MLRPPQPITSVEVLNPEIAREDVDDKGIALDLFVVLADGTKLDVEMQAQRRRAARNRSLYYWARLYGSQLEPGMGYESLRKTISVAFLDYEELPGTRLHSVFRIREDHDGALLTDALEMHVIELPKRHRVDRAARQAEPDLLAWSRFLGATTDEEVEEACMSDPNVERTREFLEFLSREPSAKERARRRELAQACYRIEMGDAFHEGLEKGREEGLEKGREEGLEKGREEGRRLGLADALSTLLRARFGELDDATQERVASATVGQLEVWTPRVMTVENLNQLFDSES